MLNSIEQWWEVSLAITICYVCNFGMCATGEPINSYGLLNFSPINSFNMKENLQHTAKTRGLDRMDRSPKPTPEMIVDEGYPVEIHSVTTEDGYVLQLHRIPYGLKPGAGPNEGPKVPVLLQHGLVCSSADWVIGGPDHALAFMLADSGYDVWMGNARGNTYSRKHVSLDPEDTKFWEFSWDQHAEFDLPAQINQITAITGKEEIYYVGHSMGSTMFFAMCDLRPEMRDKIKAMFALGPVARVDHMISPLALLAPFVGQIEWLAVLFGLGEFLPSTIGIDFLGDLLCEEQDWTNEICSSVMFLIFGYSPSQLNETLLPLHLAHTPAGTSTRTLVHYAQEINSGKFQRFDYGEQGNLEHYGSNEPPEYDLAMVTMPVVTFWSNSDWLAQPEDVEWLKSRLPNLLEDEHILAEFNHLDFVWGIDADNLVNRRITGIIESLESAS